MPSSEDPDASLEQPGRMPIFEVPQPGGAVVTLDFTTVGPFGDFAFTARVRAADGTVRERIYGAYHTQEPLIFVQILQHWARVAEPADILTGLEHADVVRGRLTEGLVPTAQSENDFQSFLRGYVEPLAVLDFLPTDHEHADEGGGRIVLSPRRADLAWISQRRPRTTFTVPPDQLWTFVVGMMWRTYDRDRLPLSRLNTAAYEVAIATFRLAIQRRIEPLVLTEERNPDARGT